MSDGPNLSWLYAVAVQALGVLTLVYLVALFGVETWNLGRPSPRMPPPADRPVAPVPSTSGRPRSPR